MVKLAAALCVAAVLGSSTSHAAPPAAEDTTLEAEARRQFDAGVSALASGNWQAAEASFRSSLRLVPRQSTKYDLALVLFKQGRFRASLGLVRELLAEPPGADARYQSYAERLLARVNAELATLELALEPRDARVTIDGESFGGTGAERRIQVDPGDHELVVTARGRSAKTIQVRVGAGETRRLSMALSARETARAPAPLKPPGRPRSSQFARVGPWLTAGVGGALLIGGLVVGTFALRADNDFVRSCPSLEQCDSSLRDDRRRVITLGHVADALLVSGAVLAAGGVTWGFVANAAGKSPADHAFNVSISARY